MRNQEVTAEKAEKSGEKAIHQSAYNSPASFPSKDSAHGDLITELRKNLSQAEMLSSQVEFLLKEVQHIVHRS